MTRRSPALSAGLRWTRGLLLGLAMILLTSIAHTAGDGQLPGVSAYLLMLPLCAALGVATMTRSHGWAWFACYAVGVQALLHVLLVTTSGHAAHEQAITPSPAMLLAHAVAAVAVGLLLAHGDALLLRWLAYMRAALSVPASRLPLVTPRSLRTPWRPPLPCSSTLLEHKIARRGPPARCH